MAASWYVVADDLLSYADTSGSYKLVLLTVCVVGVGESQLLVGHKVVQMWLHNQPTMEGALCLENEKGSFTIAENRASSESVKTANIPRACGAIPVHHCKRGESDVPSSDPSS